MKALAVDFRTPPRPPAWAWIGLGILTLTASATLVTAFMRSQDLARREAELRTLQARLETSRVPQDVRPQPKPYDASAREFVAQATSPWPTLLSALESVEIEGVTPTSIDISPTERVIRVEVEFTDYAKLLAYIDALNAGEPVVKWKLVQASASERSAASGVASPSSASLRADWSETFGR